MERENRIKIGPFPKEKNKIHLFSEMAYLFSLSG